MGHRGSWIYLFVIYRDFFIPKLKNKKQTKKIPQIKIRTFENVFATSVSCHQMVLKSKTDVKIISVPVTALNLRLEKIWIHKGRFDFVLYLIF